MPADSAIFATREALRWSLSQPVRIFKVTGTCTALTTASRMRPTSVFVPQQSRAGRQIADFLCRAAHIDVDDLRAAIDIVLCRLRHHRRLAARNLHRHRLHLALMIGAAPALRRVPQAWIGCDHLGNCHARAQTLAELAERTVGNSRHRRNNQIILELMWPDLHDCAWWGLRTLRVAKEKSAILAQSKRDAQDKNLSTKICVLPHQVSKVGRRSSVA